MGRGPAQPQSGSVTLGMSLLKTTSHLYSEGSGISWASLTLGQGMANFFYKEPNSNIFGFAGHMVPVTITQLGLCCRKAAGSKM